MPVDRSIHGSGASGKRRRAASTSPPCAVACSFIRSSHAGTILSALAQSKCMQGTTMPRLPDIDPTTLDEEGKRVYDAIVAGPRGLVEEPLRVWLNSPTLADRAQALGAFCRYGTSLEPRLSELAILVTG